MACRSLDSRFVIFLSSFIKCVCVIHLLVTDVTTLTGSSISNHLHSKFLCQRYNNKTKEEETSHYMYTQGGNRSRLRSYSMG